MKAVARSPLRLIMALLCCTLLAAEGRAAPPQEVRTGLYLMNLYDLNMDEHSFYADFYIWFKWRGRRSAAASVLIFQFFR